MPTRPQYTWLRKQDQRVVACVGCMLLAAAVGTWWQQSGMAGLAPRLVEFEAERPREFQFRVDVNRASWPELAQLPRIGETLARRIVADRESQGAFRTPDDLQRVRGIGIKTVARIAPHLAGFEIDD